MTDRPYEVGYGKPPLHSRFKPGQSGNPAGKRKPKPGLSDRLDRILAEMVSVTEAGRSRRIAKEEVFLRQMVNKAIAGDRQFGRLLLDYLQRRQEQPQAQGVGATDAFLIEELSRMLGGQAE
jgi:hypothetical protein